MRIILIFIITLFAGPALSQSTPYSGKIAISISGEELTKYCRSYMTLQRAGGKTNSPQTAYEAGLCFAFIIGIREATQWADDKASHYDTNMGPFCVGYATSSSVVEAVAVWLDAHPEQRAAAGYVLTRRALTAKFPC